MRRAWPILRYTGTARAVLLCVVGLADPQAFVIIGEANEVIGEGFRPHPPPK